MDSGFWTVKELAQNLKISLTKAYQLVYKDGFPAMRVSKRRIIVPVDRLMLWVDENLGLKN